MAVLRVKPVWEGRRYTERKGNIREYERVFLVETDSKQDDGPIVKTAVGIPQRGDYYSTSASFDVAAKCIEVSAEQLSQSPYWWRVTASYSSEREKKEEDDNPLLDRPEIEFSFETQQVPIFATCSQQTPQGQIITFLDFVRTAAGEPFDPPPLTDKSRLVCTVTRNEPSYSPALAALYTDSVNSDAVFGLQPRQIKCRGIPAQGVLERNGIPYWRVTYTLAIDNFSWDLQVLNQGTYYLTSAGSTEINYFESNGVRSLGFLRSDGTKYTSTTFVSTDLILQKRVKKELPFAALNLPLF